MQLMELSCPVRHYAWGERGSADHNPLISELLGRSPGEEPWAELWIGAHPSDSAILKQSSLPLTRLIQDSPLDMLGIKQDGISSLPFLLKVLCCSEPLSIQSHPDKATATRLHAELPKEFPDANHKPEVLYALTDFRLMAGFRRMEEVLSDLQASPALHPWRQAIPAPPTLDTLTRFPLEADASLRSAMAEGYCLEPHDGIQAEQFRILQRKYPGDCGVFFALLLNVFILHPGEAVFVQANIPHAYLNGRGIECMANSDNVIRAGLTPKYVNRALLMETLDFTPRSPNSLRAQTPPGDFDFACGEDFRLRIIQCSPYQRTQRVPGVFIVLEGSAMVTADEKAISAPKGSIWFAPASISNLRITPERNSKIAWAET